MIPGDEELQESRERLGVPDDWEWYECANECGDVVWCPPQIGDLPVKPVCSTKCALELTMNFKKEES